MEVGKTGQRHSEWRKGQERDTGKGRVGGSKGRGMEEGRDG